MEHSFAARSGHPYLSRVSGRKEERVQRRTRHVLVVDDDEILTLCDRPSADRVGTGA